MADGKLLRDHAAERETHDMRPGNVERVEDAAGVFGVVGHGVLAFGLGAAAHAALIKQYDLEVVGQHRVERVGTIAQIPARAAEKQQGRAFAAGFKNKLQAVGLYGFHDESLR